MPAHYDQIGVERVRLIQNLLCHRSGRLVHCDFDAGLLDFFVPLHKLRPLAVALWNRLRHRVELRDRHTRYCRRLGHSRQARFQHACRESSRRQFFHMNEMNLGMESFGELSCQIDHRRRYIGKINRNKDMFHSYAIELTLRAA